MITQEEILNKISDILEADFECPREKLTMDVKLFEELDLDSIDAVDLIVRLQQFTGKKVNPEAFKQIRTLGDVVRAVEALVNEKADTAQ
ncbi:MAG: acyl carrier protein [Candidatus Spyradosoma sp.]